MRPTFQLKDIMLVALVFALAAATFRARQAVSSASEKNKLLCKVQRRLPYESAGLIQLARLPVSVNEHTLFRVKARRRLSLVAKATDATAVREISLPLPQHAEWLGISAVQTEAGDAQNMSLWIGDTSKRVLVPGPPANTTLPSTNATNGRLPIPLAISKNATGRTIEFLIR